MVIYCNHEVIINNKLHQMKIIMIMVTMMIFLVWIPGLLDSLYNSDGAARTNLPSCCDHGHDHDEVDDYNDAGDHDEIVICFDFDFSFFVIVTICLNE